MSEARKSSMDVPKAVGVLSAVPETQLDAQQRRALDFLLRHLTQHTAADEGGDDDEDDPLDGSGQPSRKRKRGKADARGSRSWTAVLKLRQVTLEPAVVELVSQFQNAPDLFLDDRKALQHDNVGANPTDGLLGNFVYTRQVAKLGGLNTLRFGYCMLSMYDFVQRLWPNNKSGRIGSKMKAEFRAMASELSGLNMPLEEFCEQISRWSLCGSRLDMLCAEFGDGCLLFLHPVLSEDFLSDKCPLSGRFKDQAFEHLKHLGLKEKVAYAGADRLGSSVRRKLNDPFQNMRSSTN